MSAQTVDIRKIIKMIKSSYSEQVEALTAKIVEVLKSYDKRKGESSVALQIGDMGKSDKDVRKKRRCRIHTEGKSTGASCSALFQAVSYLYERLSLFFRRRFAQPVRIFFVNVFKFCGIAVRHQRAALVDLCEKILRIVVVFGAYDDSRGILKTQHDAF